MNIVAIGGGGFTHETDAALENYLLSLVNKDRPKIGFLPTASNDNELKIKRFYDRFKHCGEPSHLSINSQLSNIGPWILSQDIIYIGGGNTKNMLHQWHAWGLPDLLHEALRKGATLAGVSAGAVCWFDIALSDSAGIGLRPMQCIGMLKGSCCPHFCNTSENTKSDRRTVFHALITNGTLPAGIGIDDGAAVHYRNGELFKVISARDGATAWLIESVGTETSESRLTAEQLTHNRLETDT